ncbi:MAG TPA: N-acetylmuramoyl-L-alanine amidase [Bacillales bacterium]|nr:N-acetylmuramoyl-L-alanine amidase [Bacillales bacterium]
MKTIVIDPGHGGKDPGATYQGHLEKVLNLKLALQVREKLLGHYRVKVLMTRTKDHFISLEERTNFANRHDADYFCSIHHNAGGGTGFESYIYEGRVVDQTKKAQNRIHRTIIQELSEYNIENRGQKRSNFHVLRETEMSAILLEMLFIDTKRDLRLITDSGFRENAASAIADGLAKALNLSASEKPLYRVIAGSFKNRENAEDRVSFLEQQQMDAFVDEIQISGETYYRAQAGAFRERKNAEQRVAELRKMGLEPFIAVGNEPEETMPPRKTILGDLSISAQDMDAYALHMNPDAPRLGQYYADFGRHYGIRGDIAFAQALHETNYFRFTGIVNPEQNNYCGLGATDPKHSGASFPTPQSGVLAHIQHLYAYASTQSLPEGYPLVDPRFKLVDRGSAKTWVALNGKWAVPGNQYGQSILRNYEQMLEFTKKQTPSTEPFFRKFLKNLMNQIKQALSRKKK